MARARRNRSASRGMTVIELAFTISIIGVMMFFALKGGAMIEHMRALSTAYELEQYQRLILSYQADYRKLPGDDDNASRRWPTRPVALSPIGDGAMASLEGDGVILGEFYDLSNPVGEQFMVWSDLRHAGTVEGDPTLTGASALPDNPFDGFYGIDEGNLGQKAGSICATKIPGHSAQVIDDQLDDGKINTGKLVATSKFSIEENNHFDAPDTQPYDIEKEYIICVPLLP